MKFPTRDAMVGCLFFILFVTVRSAWDGFSSCGLPQLCDTETRLRTVFAEVGDNFTFNICVKSDGELTLKEVGRGLERKTFLEKERFSTYTKSLHTHYKHKCYQHDISITVYKVEEAEFGPMIFKFSQNQGIGRFLEFNYRILLCKTGIVFNIYKSHQMKTRSSTGNVFSKNESLYLICESSDYPPSSLSIVKKYSKEVLHTTVLVGALVYHIESVQCSHMGTYVCLYANDSSQKSTLELIVFGCPPQLCPRETKTRTIFAAVKENVNIDICVMSTGTPSLHSVFQNNNSMEKMPASKYKDSSISAKATQKHDVHYWKVNVVLRDIQEKDFSKISIVLTFTFYRSPLIYEMVLANKDFDFRADLSHPSPFSISESLTLKCKTDGLSSSSLSIVKSGKMEPLRTEVMNGSLVYTIESLQCQDMGTYLCLYNKDTSQNVTLVVHVATCMTFTAAGPSGLNHSVSDNINLVCESSDFQPSDLSIGLKDGNGSQELKTEIVNNTLVYSLDDLQCSDMATYICQHASDTNYNATLDLPVWNCPPQFCLGQDHQDIIFSEEWNNQSVSLCVIARDTVFLYGVYRGENLEEELPHYKYEYSIVKQEEESLYYDVNLQILNITSGEFGQISLIFSTSTSVLEKLLTFNILPKKAGFTFKVSKQLGSIFPYDPIDVTCESSDYPASSLGIVMKDRNKSLPTEVVDGTLVYHIDSLQCQDMGTYVCLYGEDTTQNASLVLPIRLCAPQLCPKENQTKAMTVKLNSDLNISVCVISHDDFFLEKVFLGGREDKTLEKNRYKPYNSSEVTGLDLYHFVDIEMYNITEEDFGRVTFRLRHLSVLGLRLDVEITLQQNSHAGEGLHESDHNTTNEFTGNISFPIPLGNSSMHNEPTAAGSTSTSDSFMIYVISCVCSFVALVLLGNFIYCQMRKRCFRTSSSQIKKESTGHLPVPSQQWTPYGYSVTLYENAAAEQLQEMLQETDDDGYLRPGPIYESIE